MHYKILVIVFIGLAFPSLLQSQTLAAKLTPGKPVSGTLTRLEKRNFGLTLASNQFFRVRMERRGVDSGLIFLDPGGKTVLTRDSIFEPGIVEASGAFQIGGEYQVSIQCGERPQCSYTMQLSELRPARETDQRRILAQQQEDLAEQAGNKFREAEPLLLEALRLWDLEADQQGQVSALGSLCHVSRYLDKPQSQLAFAQRLLDVSRKVGDKYSESVALYHIGIAQSFLNNPLAGIESMEKAVELCSRNNDAGGLGSTLNILGGLYSRIGQPKRALEYYFRALPIFRDTGNKRFIAAALLSIGSEKQELKLHGDSLAPLNEALELYKQLKDQRNQGIVLRRLANAAEAAGDFDRAVSLHQQVVAIFREAKALGALASSLTSLGQLLANRGEWDRAAEPLEEALRLYRGNPQAPINPITLNWLARTETERGNLDRAAELADEMIGLLEATRARAGGEGARDSYFARIRPSYGSVIEILNRRRKLASGQEAAALASKALEWSERSRAIGFRELLAQSKITLGGGVDAEAIRQHAALEKEIQTKLREIAVLERKAAVTSGKAQRDAITSSLVELRDKQERIQAKMREADPRYAASLRLPDEVQLRALLDRDAVLIEYFIGTTRSYAWAVTAEAVLMTELPGRDTLEKSAREAYAAMTARNARHPKESAAARQARLVEAEKVWTEKSQVLRQLLIEPLQASLGRKRWLIVADEWLHYVPFSAFSKSGEALEIVHLPSMAALSSIRDLAQGRPPAANLVAAFADPVFSVEDSRVKPGVRNASPGEVSLARLPFTQREAAGIQAELPPGKVKIAIGFEASREKVAATNFAEFRSVHFATHGVLNEDTPELSGVLLSMVDPQGKPRNGALRLHDIYDLKLPVDLVVLSGCETALGKNMRGEGIIGLTRGMIYAGASRVVSTLWKVDDAASAELMRLFYRALFVDGMTAGAALRKAQDGLRTQRRWQDPYYWAGFQLYGEYR